MAKTFEELVYGGGQRPSGFGRTTIRKEEPSTYSGRREADAYERGVTQRLAKKDAASKALEEKFGTDDLEQIGALKGTGLFTDQGMIPAREIGYLMQLDPLGTRAAVDRAAQIAQMEGASALTRDTSTYREGVGKGGERYFTNRSPEELSASTPGNLDIEEPVSGLKEINPLLMGGGGNVGGGDGVSQERQAFEGQLSQAQGLAEKPERDKKRVLALDKYLGGAIERASHETDVTTELDRIKSDLESGALEALRLRLEDAATLEKTLIKRAKTPMEMAKSAMMPAEYRLPWTRHGQPGQAADPALPADLTNPGGGPSVIAQTQQRQAMNEAETMDIAESGLGQEVPRTNHYAKGGKAPVTRSKLDRGGRGGGLLADVNAFTEGEGRHGYGEAGPIGMMKDIGAFYGPRLPGDIFAATLGGKGLGRAARSAGKLRAVENMFGLF